jgi:hypothetical protein
MKNKLYKFIGFFFIVAAAFTACEEDDSVNITEPDPALVLDSPTSTSVVLNFGLPDNPALTVTWTDEITGSSSYDVQVDTEEDFNNASTVGTSSTNSFSLSTSELNSILNSLGTSSLENVSLYVRISAGGTLSNVIGFSVTAYPIDGAEITGPAANDSFVLSLSTIDDTAITVSWVDSNTSSTTHEVQLAVSGTNFTSPVPLGSVTDDNSLSATHGDLNAVALGLGLASDTASDVDIRIVSTSTNGSGATDTRTSESVTVSITPYSVAFPNLYLVGDATTPGWNNNNNNTVVFRNQNVANNYVYTGYFNAGAFKLLETPGQWQPQWGTNDGSTLAVNPGGGSDPNVFSVATAGYYTYDFTIVGEGGSFTVTPYDASSDPTYNLIGLIGAAIGGWGDGDEIDLTQDPNNPHLWYALNVSFENGQEFLIRPNDDWGNGVWRYTGSEELHGQANLAGSGDNFPFTAPTGSYDFWFNDIDGSYVIVPN